jgi:hypothetical protein
MLKATGSYMRIYILPIIAKKVNGIGLDAGAPGGRFSDI